MSNITKLRGSTLGDDLRELAEMADKGELKAYAIYFVTANNSTQRWHFALPEHSLLLAGSIALHAYSYNRDFFKERDN